MRVLVHVYALIAGLGLAWPTQAALLEGTHVAPESTSPVGDWTGYPTPPPGLAEVVSHPVGLPTLRKRSLGAFRDGELSQQSLSDNAAWDGLAWAWNISARLETQDEYLLALQEQMYGRYESTIYGYQGKAYYAPEVDIRVAQVYDEFLAENHQKLIDNDRAEINLDQISEAEPQTHFPLLTGITSHQLFTLWEPIMHEGLVADDSGSRMSVGLWKLYQQPKRRGVIRQYFTQAVDLINKSANDGQWKIRRRAQYIRDQVYIAAVYIGGLGIQPAVPSQYPYTEGNSIPKKDRPFINEYRHLMTFRFAKGRSPTQFVPLTWITDAGLGHAMVDIARSPSGISDYTNYHFSNLLYARKKRIQEYTPAMPVGFKSWLPSIKKPIQIPVGTDLSWPS
ncbi:hypothetical protein BJ085DRAFT_28077 [Dimargaris cristalligena]|uniref:Uncharacterized protein n=1 Tax=Dimargaris cristalligena TaxID=215637 RepID=A0A4P9ZPB4_9FUNG|nr:hypothetical protein BJ085DRAFT_28077 [Dimargaris cristalligena]|eukprot:RKP35147.1 hypothetical protein BJ085DRAFT_28077 [Dimargaris cristalligena]